MTPTRVDGRRPVELLLFTLSTCGWCKKAKTMLEELGIGYDYLDLDKLDPDEREKVREEVKKWNPRCSFPTIVVDQQECIVGFKEEKLREVTK